MLRTDLGGRLRNTKLPRSQPLLPLFEAVVNSIHAIDAADREDGSIVVEIVRSGVMTLPIGNSARLPDIIGFKIIDNGEGFTDENRTSFETLDSRHKATLGCRGVGRLLWLKAFERAEIMSRSGSKSGSASEVSLDFSAEAGVTTRLTTSPLPFEGDGTQISLIGLRKTYLDRTPKAVQTIAQHLLEHLIWYFVRPSSAPSIRLIDDHVSVSLQDLFDEYVQGDVETEVVSLDDEKFDILHLKVRSGTEQGHRLYWCAESRVVESESLMGKVPGLHGRLKGPSGEYTYACYLSGDYLDEHVRAERTAFDLEPDDGAFSSGDISQDRLRKVVVVAAEKFLGEDLAARRQAGRTRVDTFVAHKAPRYRPLLPHLGADHFNVDPEISDRDLETLLHRAYRDLETELLEEGQSLATEAELMATDDYRAALESYMTKVDDLKKSDLANYVFHRKVVLDIFEKALRAKPDGTTTREDVLHGLIAPLRKSSDDASFSTNNNLWLIDERLAFHDFLASDRPLSTLPITGSSSTKEPDIVALNVYDEPLLVTEGQELPLASICVVELKRPLRNDAKAGEEKDPIEQALGYLKRVRTGSVKTAAGRPIPESPSVPGFCYVICDITPTVTNRCEVLNLRPTSDFMGYFGYNDNFKAYIEVISYDRLLFSARQRNRAFFDRLGLPASS